ncbi:MAG: hypothetical protein CL681_03270 [Blastopirellula sp.]|nr:hypothetical protein [Blastopirellula sp.]
MPLTGFLTGFSYNGDNLLRGGVSPCHGAFRTPFASDSMTLSRMISGRYLMAPARLARSDGGLDDDGSGRAGEMWPAGVGRQGPRTASWDEAVKLEKVW